MVLTASQQSKRSGYLADFAGVTVVVVGAAIIEAGRLLAAQRVEPPELAGWWELPGGKIEPGEDDEDALIRECHEELGVLIAPKVRVGGDWELRPGYVLRVWTASILEGEPRPFHDHSAVRWLAAAELDDVAWIPADRPIVGALRPYLDA